MHDKSTTKRAIHQNTERLLLENHHAEILVRKEASGEIQVATLTPSDWNDKQITSQLKTTKNNLNTHKHTLSERLKVQSKSSLITKEAHKKNNSTIKFLNSKHTLIIIDVLIIICGFGALTSLFLLILNMYHHEY